MKKNPHTNGFSALLIVIYTFVFTLFTFVFTLFTLNQY